MSALAPFIPVPTRLLAAEAPAGTTVGGSTVGGTSGGSAGTTVGGTTVGGTGGSAGDSAGTTVGTDAGSGMWLDNPAITQELLPALNETLLMTFFGTLVAVVLGIPLGIWLYSTAKGSLAPNPFVHQVVGFVVNVVRSLPFIILMVAIIPFTRFVVGTSLGWQAACVSLAISAVPFYARLVETSLHEVDSGKIEAVQMMGGTRRQVMTQVLVPEALPGLISSATVTCVALIGYTAMAGTVGGGGLGDLAIAYGFRRWQPDVMIACVVILIALVGIVQIVGDRLARRVDHR
ncbi:methionine ABC transporter permease [Brevibacterium litoralis]|uniref:methionine ABC transporter permease n=1 Tax=Brevibacterium litoralis TaxID=3138935 RepID=UPI0032F08A28